MDFMYGDSHTGNFFQLKQTKFEEQLALAVHADVVMGLHGAGLVNVIFSRRGSLTVELKTLYGYGLDLFAVATDARVGTHVQINLKKYFVKGGHRPIDDDIIRYIFYISCVCDI